MEGDDSKLRTKILLEVNEDFHAADKLNLCVEQSTLPEEIVKCFEEKDDTIRELASRAIIKIAGTEKGRAILAEDEQEDFLQKVRKLFDDPIVVIRANAYKCFLNMTKYTYGIDAVIRQNIVAVCVEQLIREKDESILILILQLL